MDKKEKTPPLVLYGQLYANGNFYYDFETLCVMTGQSSTTLWRLLQKLGEVPVVRWKNRNFYEARWVNEFWKKVDVTFRQSG